MVTTVDSCVKNVLCVCVCIEVARLFPPPTHVKHMQRPPGGRQCQCSKYFSEGLCWRGNDALLPSAGAKYDDNKPEDGKNDFMVG